MEDGYEGLSDAELLVRIARDDVAAFEALYVRWVEVFAAYFYRRVFDWDSAGELVAELFAVVWTRRRHFRFLGAPGAGWLYGIARRELGQYRRRKGVEQRAARRLGVQVPSWDEVSMERVEEIVDAEAVRDRLRDGFALLSEAEREAVGLRVLSDLSYAECSVLLGCSEGAVRVRVHRALRKLSSFLGPAWDEGHV